MSAPDTPPRSRLARLTRSRFLGQVGWSLGAKLWNAVLQLLMIVLLARGLPPGEFAWVASVNVVLMALTALNGFGTMRQIQFRRSVDPDDPTLPTLFDLRLWFTYGSAVLWVAACAVGLALTGEERYLAVLPIALWLALDQTVTVWNAISIVDGRTQDLLPSYTWRRLPVVVVLVAALVLDWDVVWAWSIALTAGAVLAFVTARPRQVPWAQRLWPARRQEGHQKVPFDLGYWWAEMGAQVRDLDVMAVTAVSAAVGGAYALPARLVKPMNMITMAAASVAFPRLARLPVVTTRQVALGCLAGTAPVTLIGLVGVVGAPLLPVLVGEEYDGAVAPFRILCLAAVVSGYIALLAIFLQSRSDAASARAGHAVLAFGLLQVPAATWGAWQHGAVGAAWGAVAAQAALAVVLAVLVVRQCRLEERRAHDPRTSSAPQHEEEPA